MCKKIAFHYRIFTRWLFRNWSNGDLIMVNDDLCVPGHDNYYNTEPFGDIEPRDPFELPPNTRGFYSEEFSPLNLEADCT